MGPAANYQRVPTNDYYRGRMKPMLKQKKQRYNSYGHTVKPNVGGKQDHRGKVIENKREKEKG